jgi:serine/threonine protein kinase
MSQDYVAGQHLGDYEILGVLGAGGMGKVYKVRNAISDRVEAMKILLPNLASEKELADRFLREIKLLATLHHPNIAALRTALTLDNQLVMIMEYVDGVTLSSRLHEGPIPPADAVQYVDQVLAALSYAHKLSIVHRDIKPANMMLTTDGVVKLMDFGIARSGADRSLTTTGTTLGSLNYMPPEQVRSEGADARSDIYSLGVSLYEMVTGMLPFEGGSNYSLMAAHLEQIPKAPIIHKPGLPESLNQIIMMALAKDPANRFQTADAFRSALSTVNIEALKPAPAGTTMPASWAPPYSGSGSEATMAVNTPAPELARSAASRAGVSNRPATSAGAAASFGSSTGAERPAALQGLAPSGTALPPVAASSSKRGLYMGLGALVVVGVLFAAGFYLPRRLKIHAGESKATLPTQPSSGAEKASQPATPQVAPPGADGANAVPNPPAAAQVPDTTADSAKTRRAGKSDAASQEMSNAAREQRAAAEAQAQAEKAAAAAAAAALEEAEHQEEQLTSRAASISQTLDNLKAAQSGQGYGLRGDVVSAEQRMQTYMSKGQAALQRQDGANAKKYFDQADREIAFLEKFLGR